MLSVYIPDNFIPERTYAVNTLLHHYAGYAINIVARPGQLHYEIAWEDKRLVIRDHFFGKTVIGETYLRHNRIPEKIIATSSAQLEGILSLFGEDRIESNQKEIVVHVDLFAGAFFMLTRWEESFGVYEDQHGRFPSDKALIVKEGHILRPVVDEYVSLLISLISTLGYPRPVTSSVFKVVPTCDVDIPYYWNSRPSWRLLAGRFFKNRSFAKLISDARLMREMKAGKRKDPYDTFNFLMQLAEGNGLQLIFFMLAGGESSFEGFYSIKDEKIRSLIKTFIDRGHQIGIHPSYNSFHDPKQIDLERRMLEKSCGCTVKASRQHYLRFAVPETWRHLYNAYIKEDFTLGYAAEPGFRCGTSKPFPVFDIHLHKELPLLERPLLIMDVSLKIYKQFSVEESIQYCSTIREQVKKHNGDFIFLWHNSSLSEMDGWSEWGKVLEFLMQKNSLPTSNIQLPV